MLDNDNFTNDTNFWIEGVTSGPFNFTVLTDWIKLSVECNNKDTYSLYCPLNI